MTTPHASKTKALLFAGSLLIGATILSSDDVNAASAGGGFGSCFGSADAAEHWLASGKGAGCLPTTADTARCFGSADAAEHGLAAELPASPCVS